MAWRFAIGRNFHGLWDNTLLWLLHFYGVTFGPRAHLFYCNYDTTVIIIHRGRSKAISIKKLRRQFTLCSVKFNFCILSKHLPGKTNLIADVCLVFRCQIQLIGSQRRQPISSLALPWRKSFGNFSKIGAPMSSSVSSSTQTMYY